MSEFRVENLFVKPKEADEVTVRGIDLTVKSGELHVIMGPNGSGKTTLSLGIMGSERYEIVDGRILLDGEDITDLPMEKRALKGLFIAYQAPPEVKSVNFLTFLREGLKIRGKNGDNSLIKRAFARVGLDEEFLERELYVGFSGGERKRGEMAQLLLFYPKFAILDEPDTGVDVDSLKLIAGTINEALEKGTGIVLITHYARILELLPDFYHVHVLIGGKFRAHGGPELAKSIEKSGFEGLSS